MPNNQLAVQHMVRICNVSISLIGVFDPRANVLSFGGCRFICSRQEVISL
jgi:hypothetical protein